LKKESDRPSAVSGGGAGDFHRLKRRLRWFAIHLLGYTMVAAVLIVVNLATMPETLWAVLPVVGWGAVLALHAAYVMGLFNALRS